jgi:hypothetical protein
MSTHAVASSTTTADAQSGGNDPVATPTAKDVQAASQISTSFSNLLVNPSAETAMTAPTIIPCDENNAIHAAAPSPPPILFVCDWNQRPVRALRAYVGKQLMAVRDRRPPRDTAATQNVFGAGFVARTRRSRAQRIHDSRARVYLATVFRQASHAGRQRGIDVCLHRQDLVDMWTQQNGRCALSGVPMSHTLSRAVPDAQWRNASLDRIDSAQGYSPDNTQLVCALVNRMKSNLPQARFVWWCQQIAHRHVYPDATTLACADDEARYVAATQLELDDSKFS